MCNSVMWFRDSPERFPCEISAPSHDIHYNSEYAIVDNAMDGHWED